MLIISCYFSNYYQFVGDIKNVSVLNTVTIFTKKVIYGSFINKKIPSLSHIKLYYLKKYFPNTTRKKQLFEKGWHTLIVY